MKIKNNKVTEWIEEEVKQSKFSDKRLKERFRKIVSQLARGFGRSIPFSCQDWSNTKGAYRFLSNDNFSEEQILSGHFQSSKERFCKTDGLIVSDPPCTYYSP